nr:sugar translocase [Paenibacillus bovis]
MRVKNSIKNMGAALLGQVLILALSFINRIYFIKVLGVELLGVNGLFTNLISLLSLAELGIGIAIIYSLYKPLANKDEENIKALLNYFRVIYRNIGIFIIILGFIIMPFLDYIIEGEHNISNLNLIFTLFIMNSSVTYFLSYKRSILIADQKNYIVSLYHYGSLIFSNVLQIGVLVIYENYIFYLLISLIFNIIENLALSKVANKKYPFIKRLKDNKLERGQKKELNKNFRALAYHKLGSVVLNGTDNIIISTFLGLYWVGLYSNYLIITTALNKILGQLFGAVTASVGNLNVLSSNVKKYEMYNNMLFASFWLYGFSTITFFVLSKDFISIWIGTDFILENLVVFFITINLLIEGTRKASLVFKDAMGLFWYDRYKPLAEAILNLAFSIILVQHMGITGVLLGTIISKILTGMWIEPYVVFKYGFKMKILPYFLKFAYYLLITLMTFLLTYYISSFIQFTAFINLILKFALCVIFINLIYGLVFIRTNEFNYFYKLVKTLILRK